jgi:hypothetical protein
LLCDRRVFFVPNQDELGLSKTLQSWKVQS